MSGQFNPRKSERDDRDPRVPLERPPFGDPPWARLCPRCDKWYPWYAFRKPIRRRNGRVRGSSHHVRCLVCRESVGAVPAKRKHRV